MNGEEDDDRGPTRCKWYKEMIRCGITNHQVTTLPKTSSALKSCIGKHFTPIDFAGKEAGQSENGSTPPVVDSKTS